MLGLALVSVHVPRCAGTSLLALLRTAFGTADLYEDYGRDWSVDDTLDDPWSARRLDYGGFLRDVAQVLRPVAIRSFRYCGTTVRDALEALGCGGIAADEPRANATLGATGVDMLRCLNRRALPPVLRAEAVEQIRELDRRLGAASGVFTLEQGAAERVRRLSGTAVPPA